MKYKVWDTVSYGHCEPLVPFTCIFTSNKLEDIRQFIDIKDDEIYAITVNDTLMGYSNDKIFERVGNNIYERNRFSDKRKLLEEKDFIKFNLNNVILN